MTAVICVDNRFGMLFNKRRLSRDRAVTEDIVASLGKGRLMCGAMSKTLFSETADVVVCEDFLEKADEQDVCFVEDRDIASYLEKTAKIVLYRWNRDYPSDFQFDPALLQDFSLTESTKFPGTSHEEITKEVYEK